MEPGLAEARGDDRREAAISTEPADARRRSALLHASHGFHFRNLLDTRLFELLRCEYDLVLLVHPDDARHCRADYGTERVAVDTVAIARRSYEPALEFVRRRLLVKPGRAMTTSVFSDRERRERPLRHALLRALNVALGRWSLVRRAWLALERILIPGHEFDIVFRRHTPSVVIAASYGTEPVTIRLLRAARRSGVPSITIVPSFDNLTSKGIIAEQADRMIVWNDTMRREATELHDVPPERIAACGPVQFDIYADRSRWASHSSVWSAHGLDTARPTIVVGTITPAYFPYNRHIIEIVAEAIEAGRLGRNSQVLVRVHPQAVRDAVFGDDLAGYEDLCRRYPFVRLNVPEVRRWGTISPPPKNDIAVLATILAHAAAVVVPASTLAVDAAMVDTPIIGVAFDGKTVQPPELSVARYYDFTHYKPVTASGAIAIARSADELIAAVATAIRDRSVNAEGRRRLVSSLVGERSGTAAACIVEQIRALAMRDHRRLAAPGDREWAGARV
jgi:hypothetical protein